MSAAMKKAKEARVPLMLSDLRRTAETMMAAMGDRPRFARSDSVPRPGCAQARHHNRHDYRLEKREARTKWAAKVGATPKRASVIEADFASGGRQRKR